MKKVLLTLLLGVSMFAISGCMEDPLTPMQKRQITSRVIDSKFSTTFKSTMTVLQDHGYIIKQSNIDSGLINAEISKQNDSIFFEMFAGDDSTKGSFVELSAIVSELNPKTSEVRINIQEKSYNKAGETNSIRQLYDQETFQTLFNDITVEVKRLQAYN
jgi:hypothetical protein